MVERERHPAHPMKVIDGEVYCKFCLHPRDNHYKWGAVGEGWTSYRCNYGDCGCNTTWTPRLDGIPETQETQ